MKKTIYLLIALLTLSLCLVSCGGTDTPVEDNLEVTAIETILTTKANNDKVKLQGVVYAVVDEGIYVADSQLGAIYVIVPSIITTEFKVGNKVEIVGELSIAPNNIRIKSVKSIEVLAQSAEIPHKATASSVAEVKVLPASNKTGSFGNVYTVTGYVEKVTETAYYLVDDFGAKIEFHRYTNLKALEDHDGARITIDVIATEYNISSKSWTFTFAGGANDIQSTPFTIEDAKAVAIEDISEKVPTSVRGYISLPDGHDLLPGLFYKWSVEENEIISIDENNNVKININSTTETINLKATISYEGETAEISYPVVFEAIVEQSVAELFTNTPEVDRSVVIVRGVVVAFARNQSADTRSIVIKDIESDNTIGVDFSASSSNYIDQKDEAYKSLELGHEVVITAQYRTAEANRPNIVNVRSITVEEAKREYSHAYESAYVLNSKASYEELAANLDAYSGQLVKFENPFIAYSTTVTPGLTHWVRLGYDEFTPREGFGEGNRGFAFLIIGGNENLGGEGWHTYFDIPFIDKDAKQFGIDIYAYCLYVSESYVAFIIPGTECFVASANTKVEIELLNSTVESAEEDDVLELLTAHELTDSGITWTSSNSELINPETGLVGYTPVNVDVTLTATYSIEGVVYTSEHVVTVLASIPVSVSDLIATAENGARVKVEGVVVGFGHDGNDRQERLSILLMDNETGEIVQINNIDGCTYPKYYDKEGNLIKIGDILCVNGTYLHDTVRIGSGPDQTGRKNIEATKLVVNGFEENIDYSHALSVTTEAEMLALVSDGVKFGQIFKISGAFIVTGSGTTNGLSGSNYKLAIKDEIPTDKVSDNMKFNGYSFSLKQSNLDPVYSTGENSGWQEDLYGLTSAYGASKVFEYTGTLYVVITHHTGTYYQCTLVNYEECYTIEAIEGAISAKTPTSVNPGEIKLVSSILKAGEISWTSSNPAVINVETGIVSDVNDNTEVTLTASYYVGGEVKEFEIVVTVLASKAISVHELLSTVEDGAGVKVSGVVVGFGSHGNNSYKEQKSIILMDNETNELVQLDNESIGTEWPNIKDSKGDEIQIGDLIEVNGTYYVNTEACGGSGYVAQTGRKHIVVNVITIKEKAVEVKWNDENMIQISNEADMLALVSNGVKFGQIIKISGDFIVTGSGTSNGLSGTNFKVAVKDVVPTESVSNNMKFNGYTFSLKQSNLDPIYSNEGNTGWQEDLFGLKAASGASKVYEYTGRLYLVITHHTSTYYQCMLVNYANCNATKK